ncbi:18436_t:CDS:2 [Funneliformis geosporum]|uniref:18436_t:CDS:1 n=1 Tax=Funneliformis geosporum TaxID=1117311 RepID=A0A9W4SG52_9GLOM|nr:18436_t:CDS:2 [Funneliformis geosporum]
MDTLQEINKQYFRTDLPELQVGDKVEVITKNFNRFSQNEKTKHRLVNFKGIVITQKNKKQISYTFSVLRESGKVAVRSIFLYHSPLIVSIKKLVVTMSSLKDINLKDLVKNSNKNDLVNEAVSEFNLSEQKEVRVPFSLKERAKRNLSNEFFYSSSPVVEEKKNLEADEFIPIPKQPGEIIPLTFRKFFFHAITGDITQIALKNSKKLSNLIEEAQYKIQKKSLAFVDFIFDRQISTAICQLDNYNANAKIYKKASEFQKIETVIQWIIDTNLKMQIAQHKEFYVEESRDYKQIRKLPLPLNESILAGIAASIFENKMVGKDFNFAELLPKSLQLFFGNLGKFEEELMVRGGHYTKNLLLTKFRCLSFEKKRLKKDELRVLVESDSANIVIFTNFAGIFTCVWDYGDYASSRKRINAFLALPEKNDNLAVLKRYNRIFTTEKLNRLMGKNGTGKSTVLYLLLGMLNPQEGKVIIEYQNGSSYELHRDINLQA